MKKPIWLFIISLFTLLSKVEAVRLWTLKWNIWWDIPDEWTLVTGQRSVFDMIKVVNSYIRFGVGFVCFLFMIINGYKLITANWDSKQTEAATSALIKSIIWVAVCLLAYIIVNLAVKLFA